MRAGLRRDARQRAAGRRGGRLLGPWLAHARARRARTARRSSGATRIDLTTGARATSRSPILALMNTGASCARAAQPALVVPADRPAERGRGRSSRGCRAPATSPSSTSARRRARRSQCWVLDSGAGGLLGGILASIYAELGLPRPQFDERRARRDAPSPSRRRRRDRRRRARRAAQPRPADRARRQPARARRRRPTSARRRCAPRSRRPSSTRSARAPRRSCCAQVLRRGYLDPQGATRRRGGTCTCQPRDVLPQAAHGQRAGGRVAARHTRAERRFRGLRIVRETTHAASCRSLAPVARPALRRGREPLRQGRARRRRRPAPDAGADHPRGAAVHGLPLPAAAATTPPGRACRCCSSRRSPRRRCASTCAAATASPSTCIARRPPDLPRRVRRDLVLRPRARPRALGRGRHPDRGPRGVSEDAGGAPVQLVGWCLGGIMSLLSVAGDADAAGQLGRAASPARSTSRACGSWRRSGRSRT